MSEQTIVVGWFNYLDRAQDVAQDLRALRNAGRVRYQNVAIVEHHADGKVSMKDMEDVEATEGTLFGALTGGLIGLLISGPPGAVAGAASGAATGGVVASLLDFGFSTHFLEEIKRRLRSDSSAIVVLLDDDENLDELNATLNRYGGTYRSSPVPVQMLEIYQSGPS
ncbi:MAG: DUF1269 domain-containing protein [Chloroflexi bacterium]|nr:DUF1269 domain-containing protein [Chloroflexota bacterium]